MRKYVPKKDEFEFVFERPEFIRRSSIRPGKDERENSGDEEENRKSRKTNRKELQMAKRKTKRMQGLYFKPRP